MRAPDLTVRGVWFAKFVDNVAASTLVAATQPLKAGEKILMICDVANDGVADVAGTWLLGFYVDGVMVWNNSWGPLGAGRTLRGAGPWTPGASGPHVLRCVLDVQNTVRESSETDNQAEIPFQVGP
jgi:subtilase family serine protease